MPLRNELLPCGQTEFVQGSVEEILAKTTNWLMNSKSEMPSLPDRQLKKLEFQQ